MPYILSTILFIAILYVIFALVVLGLIVLLRKVRVSSKMRFFLAFLIFGAISGVLAYLRWPTDMSVLFGFPAVYIADEVYVQSINLFGDPHSSQAHYTIPWIFRVPQVYVLVSLVFWGLIGLIVQLIHNKKDKISRFVRCHQLHLKERDAC